MANEGLKALGTDEGDDNDSVAFENSGLRRATLPQTLKRIGHKAFRGCRDLKNIRLPDGLEYVGEKCFYESGLENARLPFQLRMVGSSAFASCEHLRTICVEEGCEVDLS